MDKISLTHTKRGLGERCDLVFPRLWGGLNLRPFFIPDPCPLQMTGVKETSINMAYWSPVLSSRARIGWTHGPTLAQS